MTVRSVLLCFFLLAGALGASANPAPNAATDWALIVQQSIHNAGAPRSAGISEIIGNNGGSMKPAHVRARLRGSAEDLGRNATTKSMGSVGSTRSEPCNSEKE